MTATPPFIEIDGGHKLHVRDWGSGPTILLMAGWAMDSRLWSETMTTLNDAGFRTVAYDRRGHGRSTDPGVVDYDMLADDLAKVINSLHLKEVTLVAHSGAGGETIRYVIQPMRQARRSTSASRRPTSSSKTRRIGGTTLRLS